MTNYKFNKKRKNKAIVLLSGGLDSAVSLYSALSESYQVSCLSFDYGQRHKKELKAAQKIAKKAGCQWQLVKISLPWKGSSLLDKTKKIPRHRKIDAEIPSTYVPARNIIFLSFAASFAESVNASAIFIGANEIDYSGYPDCRQEFLDAFSLALQKGTKAGTQGVKTIICAPLVKKNKQQIVELAIRLGVPLELTWSCYSGGKKPCGTCDSCILRAQGFAQAKMKDPAGC
ncbi:MAG: 7-cyano-7-deazaguanine synthase QueC [Candidatus Omnitrophica bacterium]|nr:7-cyano-7-deazaguanine synthase QueC [Candidatus Omnitrophota bacterium]